MATEVKRRRGTTTEHSTFTGAVAELTVDLTKDTVVVHDGATQGGFPLLREDFSNVPTTAPFTHITLDTAIFDTTYTKTGSETQGTLYWNSDEETISLVTNGESFELGQKTEIHVKNQTGAQINKGEVVYASGTLGNSGRILITKMIANGTVPAKRIMGVTAENIANGADGKIITFGKLKNINTSSFSDGDILYVSASTAGAFQNTEPSQASGHVSLPIGYVIHAHSNGQIFIRVTPIDENEYQDYDAQLTTLSGLSADQAQDLVDITASEYTQLQNINSVTISNTQWGYLGALDQALATGDSPTFGGLTVNGNITVTGNVDGRDVSADGADLDELYTTIGLSALTSDEVNQLENIGSTTIDATQWGYLGALDQNLRTTDAVTFSTVDTGQGANELYAMDQDVQQADSPTFNRVVLTNQADDGTKAVRADRDISAGDGVTGGGDLTADRTLTLGTPSTTTVGGSNAVTTNSHTHALDLSGRSITLSDDSDSVITFDTNTQDLGADRTYTPTIADHASGQRGVLNTTAQTIYGDKTFDADVFLNTKIESASGYTSGILGAGTRYTTDQQEDDSNVSFFEVDNMRVRNELRVHVFKKDIVKASNAYLFITDSAEIAETSVIVDTTDTFRVLADGSNASFAHGDLLWAKNIDDDGSLQVTGVKIEVSVQPQFVWDTSEETWNTTTITPDSYTEFVSGTVTGGIHNGKTYTEYNIYEVTSGGTLNAGDTIVRISDGSILNDASSQYSPFIDIYDGVETWAQFQDVSKTKVRLGNLEGVSNASGYGLYTQNAFLTGALVVGDLTKAGQYMEFDGSTLTVKGDVDITGTTIFKSSDSTGDTATTLNDITFIDGSAIVTNSITATQIDAGTITANEIASDTITANEIASNTITASEIFAGTITATEIASNTITANEIDANTITANEIATNTITASEIAAGTITATEIAAGTITANEIDVADLFSQNATVAGTLTIGSGGSLASSAVNFGQNTFSLDVTDLDINSTNALIQVGHDTTSYSVKLGLTDVSSSPTHSGKYGLEIDTNNYWKAVKGFDTDPDRIEFKVGDGSKYLEFDGTDLSIATDAFTLETTNLSIDSANEVITLGSGTTVTVGKIDATNFGLSLDAHNFWKVSSSEYFFKVGTATNFISFDTSSGTLDITADTFDLATSTFVIDSDNNKIALGTGPDSITIAGTEAGFIATGAGEFKGYIDANNLIRLDSTGLDIKSEEFKLQAGELVIDSTQDKKIKIANATEEIIAIGDFDFGAEVEDTTSSSATSTTTTKIKTSTATPINLASLMDTTAGTYTDSTISTDGNFILLKRTYNNTKGKWIRVQFNYQAPAYDGDLSLSAVGFNIFYFGETISQTGRAYDDTNTISGSVDKTLFVPATYNLPYIEVQALAPVGGLTNGNNFNKVEVSSLSITEYDNTYTYTDIGKDGFRVYNSGGRNKLDFSDGKAEGTFETLSIGEWDFLLDNDGNLELQYDGTLVQQFTRPT